MLPVALGSSCSMPHQPGALPPWAWLTPHFLSGFCSPTLACDQAPPGPASSSSASSHPSAYPSPLPIPTPMIQIPTVCAKLRA